MTDRRPILVTGSPRSGTTWVGSMVAAAPGIAYLHEPFNADFDSGVCNARFNEMFTYVCEENERRFYDAIRDTLRFRYHFLPQMRRVWSASAFARTFQNQFQFFGYRRTGARALIKDPIAIFSAPWLAARFDVQVVILIRHPLPFVNSMKRLNWGHDFSGFLRQPLLMRDFLSPFEAEISAFARQPRDIVEQAALLWNLIYSTVSKFKEDHPDWTFVRHEDLSNDPLSGFRAVYEALNLTYTDKIERIIASNPRVSDLHRTKIKPFAIRRKPESNSANWLARLSEEETARVMRIVRPVADDFYPESLNLS